MVFEIFHKTPRLTAVAACLSLVVAGALTLGVAHTEPRSKVDRELSDKIIKSLGLDISQPDPGVVNNVASAADTEERRLRREIESVRAFVDADDRERVIGEIAQSKPSVELTSLFRPGSADIDFNATSNLDALGKALEHRLAVVAVTVPADPAVAGGGLALADRRAEAVKEYLSAAFQVRPFQIIAMGSGKAGNQSIRVVNLSAP